MRNAEGSIQEVSALEAHEHPKGMSGKRAKKLTPSEKAEAKKSAKAAGRPYPNLVDNMKVARKRK